MRSSPQLIVRSYLALTGLYTLSTSLIWGVNTLFLLDAGLTLAQSFYVNAFYTAAMVLFEIPTGVLADTRGRRLSFLFSISILIVGTIGYVAVAPLQNSFWPLAVMSVILGLGYTFYSGAMEAWLVDALSATGYEGQLDDVFARGAMITSAAMLVGTVSGGLMAMVSLAIPYYARILLLFAVLLTAFLTMHDLGFSPRQTTLRELPAEMAGIAEASIDFGWRQPSIRLLASTSFFLGLFTNWGFYAWQPYFLDLLGQDLPWVAGLIAALVALATMAGNRLAQFGSIRAGRRTTLLLLAAVLMTVSAIGVGLVGSFWTAVALYLLHSLASGLWLPIKQAYMHQLIPSAQRATVISFDSLLNNSGSAVGQPALGLLAEQRSIAAAYVLGGAVTAAVWPLVLRLRRREDSADYFALALGSETAHAFDDKPVFSYVEDSGDSPQI